MLHLCERRLQARGTLDCCQFVCGLRSSLNAQVEQRVEWEVGKFVFSSWIIIYANSGCTVCQMCEGFLPCLHGGYFRVQLDNAQIRSPDPGQNHGKKKHLGAE